MKRIDQIQLNDWQEVRDWVDSSGLRIPGSYLDRVNKRIYPVDAFSLGQLASKAWLMQQLYHVIPLKSNATVGLFGCWIGALVPFLHNAFTIKRIYGFDLDSESVALSERFNEKHVQDSWKYKGVVADVSLLTTSALEFETGGELIDLKPDWVINTSCEHMNNNWFESADSEQLIIMQSNNSPDFDGHINTCTDIEHFKAKYPMSKTHFVGELTTPAYTRFMQIGYK